MFSPNSFLEAFDVQVRASGPMTVEDTREGATNRLFGTTNTEQIVVLMMDVAEELAVMLSQCVGVNSAAKASYQRLKDVSEDELDKHFSELESKLELPLIAKKGHPAEQFLCDLLVYREGRVMYQRLACALLWAHKQNGKGKSGRDLRGYLWQGPTS
jgi:hypothetical protein